ncbi:MAG: DUF4364 family protein [Ruminococcaceae bacterium]|nr:DUF4364 family protein [Oscillospiraceae bacterium]
MDISVVKSGVAPGGPDYDFEVKLLICWMLAKITKPMTVEHMIEALVSEQFVNYFEFTGAVTDLIVEGQLVEVEKDQLFRNLQPNPSFFSPTAPYAARRTGYYTLSSENKKHVLLLEHTLPLSLREKVYASATAVLLKANRESGNTATVRRNGDAWAVDISVNDMGSDLLRLSMYAPTPEIADFMKENFLNDPAFFYKGIIALLSGDPDQLKSIEPTPDENYYR